MESELRVHESDHASEEFFFLGFLGVLESGHVLDCLFNGYLLFVDFSELSFSHLFDFVWHLRLCHFWEVFANFLVNSFQTFKVSLGHLR